MSLPSRERGLKYPRKGNEQSSRCRSPRGSADWNLIYFHCDILTCVAPLAGARIEIKSHIDKTYKCRSLPSRERGLKFMGQCFISHSQSSLPSRERGLKWIRNDIGRHCGSRSPRGSADWNWTLLKKSAPAATSLPSRERGLKYLITDPVIDHLRRSPRGSADWNIRTIIKVIWQTVAPLAGARIEITTDISKPSGISSLPSRERGLKSVFHVPLDRQTRRSPRGSADWNSCSRE